MKRVFLFLIITTWLLTSCSGFQLGPPVASTPNVETPLATPTPHFYVVRPGDTLWAIAKKTGVDVNTLVAVNELKNPDALRPGDRLLISDKVTISGQPLPTPTPTPIPCLYGCIHPPAHCKIKGYQARLDGMKLYVLPEDEIYPMQQADVWFCREQDARNMGWQHWTPDGPE